MQDTMKDTMSKGNNSATALDSSFIIETLHLCTAWEKPEINSRVLNAYNEYMMLFMAFAFFIRFPTRIVDNISTKYV